MNLNEFLKDTQNKWVKIDENDGYTIIQNVTDYTLNGGKGYFTCSGKSFSNCGGDVIELDEFYMTRHLLNGHITMLSDEDADTEIKKMLNKESV